MSLKIKVQYCTVQYFCWIPQNLPSSNLHNMAWSLVHRRAFPAAGGGKQCTQSIWCGRPAPWLYILSPHPPPSLHTACRCLVKTQERWRDYIVCGMWKTGETEKCAKKEIKAPYSTCTVEHKQILNTLFPYAWFMMKHLSRVERGLPPLQI